MDILKNFIVFEGLDGAGTTTQSKLLVEKIKNSVFTNEPTDRETGKLIRKCLRKEAEFSGKTLPYLFAADRAEHIYGKDGIIELCKNHIVFCDRYLFSSIAYQALENDYELILKLNENFPMPEAVFFINTSITECQKRINSRGEKKELFEDRALQEKILANYIRAFEHFDDKTNIITLDGDLSIEELLVKETEWLKKLDII